MGSVQDAIYNWLTIKVVVDARPKDLAAVETENMFFSILRENHSISEITYNKDEMMYNVTFLKDGKKDKMRFPIELIEVMMNQINEAPDRYRIYPSLNGQ